MTATILQLMFSAMFFLFIIANLLLLLISEKDAIRLLVAMAGLLARVTQRCLAVVPSARIGRLIAALTLVDRRMAIGLPR